MNKFRTLNRPNLPDGAVSHVLVSGLYPAIPAKLNKLGIKTALTAENPGLPFSLNMHADMQFLQTGPGVFYTPENLHSYYSDLLSSVLENFELKKIPALGNKYPDDTVLNILLTDCYAFGLKKNMSLVDLYGYTPVYIRQGYARCTAVAITGNAIITDDEGIQQSALKIGLESLLIEKGSIVLEGYKEGFIGGCCGMLGPDILAVTGCLDCHISGKKIFEFCRLRGIKVIELTDGPLVDIGGIIPIACGNL